jgi:hypothetical protein
MNSSMLLFVCFLDKKYYITKRMDAKTFKAEGYQDTILFFCNWAGDPIDFKTGLRLYRSI